ncbi:MAG: autotransporter-associated beta strand repeat-containing protein, partial [Burkholderiales bacterium]|nr:autotransporter-associated beta strand repeat-containing protein [Phycisphaerae bacterium]
ITSATSGADSTTIAVGRDGDNTVGTINLNGGTLSSARRFVRDGSDGTGAGIANFNFNGGTLRALASNTDWIASSTATYTMDVGGVPTAITNANQKEFSAVTVMLGGAKVDTNGFDVGINNVLAHDATLGVTPDGGLLKTGTGTLTLGGSNTYTGGSTITTGTVNATNASSFGTGAVAVGAAGTAFLNNDQAATSFTYANNFTGSGLIKVQPRGLSLGDTTVLTGDMSGFTGTLQVLPGFFNNGYVNLGQTTQATTPAAAATIQIDNGGALLLNKTLAYYSNFSVAGTGSSENLGAIRFTSNATIIGNVALQADTTLAVTANGGAIGGVISGNFGITKKGGSTFALINTSPHTYTGTTRIEEGTLSVGNGSFIGPTGTGLTGGDGTLGTGPTHMAGGGTLRFNRTTGSPYTYNGNITADATRGIINNQGTVPITLGGTNKIDNFFRVWGGGETIITGNTQVGDETSNSFNQGWTSIGILNGNPPQPGPGILTIATGGSYSGMGTSDGGIPNSLIGGAITGTASINVNGGTLLFGGRQGYIIGQGNSGTQATIANLNVNSGSATFQASTITSATSGADSTTIAVGRDGDNTVGTINLNGGTLSSARRFVRDGSDGAGAGIANFNFNGGTLRALASNTDWIASSTATYTMDVGGVPTAITNANQKEFSAVTVMLGGAKVDTNGFDVGINNVLVHDATLGVTPDGGLLKSGTGTLSVGGVNTYTGPTSVTAGKLLTVNGVKNRAAASISGNAVWEVPINGLALGVTAVSSVTIPTSGANFAGTLELHDNDLIVDYTGGSTSYASVLAKVKSGLPLLGFGGNGTGITSAEVIAQGAGGVGLNGTMLGVIDGGTSGGQVTSLSGFTVPNPTTSVLVKYTWRGDANLDGVVNGSDYALADTGFSGGGTGWFYGDVNYDGVINGSDYALIDTGFSSQTGPLPEPAMLSLLGLGAMSVLRRRRRAV